MTERHVVVVGAGPGGLACAMLLSEKGFSVTVLEKEAVVGGRNAALECGPYRFDVGPTFLMMRFVLDALFHRVDRDPDDYLNFFPLEPMYQLDFVDQSMKIFSSNETEKEQAEIERLFPDQTDGLARFYQQEGKRFNALMPSLQRGFKHRREVLSKEVLRALPYLAPGKSLFEVLQGYFQEEELSLAFTFQAKYLGMSPWECPGAFAIIPYIEHAFGMYHVEGGLNAISHAFARVVEEEGGRVRTNAEVAELLLDGRVARGVRLASGEEITADAVVVNADFAYAMSELVGPGVLKKYSRERLAKKKYSCSTFMLYLGLDTLYDAPHHNVVFADDYRTNVDDIFKRKVLSDDFSLYVHNPSVTDPTLAPEGHSAVYVLMPVPNNESTIDWDHSAGGLRERALDLLEARTVMTDIRQHIQTEHMITPWDWQHDYHVYRGATFNLSHHLNQMLVFRPRNQFEELANVFLVGGGTHPGSGLPTIYQSAMISSDLIRAAAGQRGRS